MSDLEDKVTNLQKAVIIMCKMQKNHNEITAMFCNVIDIIRSAVKQNQAEINELKRRLDEQYG